MAATWYGKSARATSAAATPTAVLGRALRRQRHPAAGEDDRTETVAGRQAGPGRHPAGRQGDHRNRQRARRRARCRLPVAGFALGVLDADRDAAFIERLRNLSGGKPTGFKLAIGHPWEFFGIVKAMLATGITPDFIVVDGGEGGTGAAPVEFSDHVGAPLQEALLLVHNTLVGAGLRDRIKIGASGKIITAFDIVRTIALGADWCNSARGFMFALGCVQSQSCHTDRCPTGVATQDLQRQKALDVPDKTSRVANFHLNTMKALAQLIAAAGLTHPSQLKPHHIVRRVSPNQVKLASALLPYLSEGELLDPSQLERLPPVFGLYWPMAQAESFHPLQ
jgi:hypothetical protein